MNIAVTDSSPLPLYRQIYDQVAAEIIRGDTPPGSPLPPIRTVAAELRVSVISVKRAWEELERDGFIVTAVGRGSFAAALSPDALTEKRRGVLLDRLAEGVAFCRTLGAGADEVSDIVRELLQE